MAKRTTVKRQIRGFAVMWTAISLTIGLAVFFAIYLTYSGGESPLSAQSNVSLPATPTPRPANPTITPQIRPSQTPQTDAGIIVAQVAQETPATEETTAPSNTPVAVAQVQQEPTNPPAPTATLLPVNQTDFVVSIQVQNSVDANPDVQRIWMNDVQALGLTWMKMQIRWAEIELAKGEFNWNRLDLALQIASEYGIQVLATIVAAPEWAREPNADLSNEGPPTNDQDLADFLTVLLNRYPNMIHAIEVWNETNLIREWGANTGVNAADYVQMLRVANRTIKDIDPGIIVISAAPSPTGANISEGGIDLVVDDFIYVDRLLTAGVLDHADCFGAHHNGYNISPSVTWDTVPNDPTAEFRGPFENRHPSWSFRSTLTTYANKIQTAGGTQKLCVTEFGWASVEDLSGGFPAGFEFSKDNTLQEQSTWIIEALNNMEEWGFVWIANIWNLNYGAQMGWDATNDNVPYSLIGPDFTRRPAFDAVAEWTAARRDSQ
ncbi:MAG: hypothetical protein SH821_14315 [Phototrophicales bacterium]|nr:hypothetical protein [Phototrophicales bacterium]